MLKKTELKTMMKTELKKQTKLTIRILSAVVVAFVPVGVCAQKQTHKGTQGASQSQAQSKHEQTGNMSHEHCPMMQSDKSQMFAQKSRTSADAASHAGRVASVDERGARVMGFSQTETTHHFILTRDGGTIQVEVNDSQDTVNRGAIRTHLAHVAQMFAAGNFEMPMLVHDETPPGVSVMQRLKAEIAYVYEETARGARVRISTRDRNALAAVHDFLRFQIKDHRTGDSLDVSSR